MSSLDNLNAAATFAREFLRRNSAYRIDFKSIMIKDDAALLIQRRGCAADPDLRAGQAADQTPTIKKLTLKA